MAVTKYFQRHCASLNEALAVSPFFEGIGLKQDSSCSYSFHEWPFFYNKRIAATHFFL